jgi:hypothetical protein
LNKLIFKSSFVLFLTATIYIVSISVIAYDEKHIPASYYISYLSNKIKNNWHPPKEYAGEHLIVSFRIYPNGTISNLDCKKIYDPRFILWKAVSEAIRKCLPFPPPPDELLDKRLRYFRVSFDMSAFYYLKDKKVKPEAWGLGPYGNRQIQSKPNYIQQPNYNR